MEVKSMRTEIFCYLVNYSDKTVGGFCAASSEKDCAQRVAMKYGRRPCFVTNNVEDFISESFEDDDFFECVKEV